MLLPVVGHGQPTLITKHQIKANESQSHPLWSALEEPQGQLFGCHLRRSIMSSNVSTYKSRNPLGKPILSPWSVRLRMGSFFSDHICFLHVENNKGPRPPSRKLLQHSWILIESTSPGTNVGRQGPSVAKFPKCFF
jgi:hypothetical protein